MSDGTIGKAGRQAVGAARMQDGARDAGKQVGFCAPNSREFQAEEQEENKDAEGKEGNYHLSRSVRGRVIC